jgi:hypothetical protein
MNDLVKQYLFSGIRYIAPLLAAIIVKKYGTVIGLDETDVTTFIVTASTAAIMFVWSLFNKARYETKVDTALSLPGGSSRETLKDVVNSGG